MIKEMYFLFLFVLFPHLRPLSRRGLEVMKMKENALKGNASLHSPENGTKTYQNLVKEYVVKS